MEPDGNLVDILEYRKDIDFYCTPYKQSVGYKFESDELRETIKEELQKYAIPAIGSTDPAADNASSLGRLLYYFIPEFDPSSLVKAQTGSDSDRELSLTPERATTLAYWYIEAVHQDWNQIETVEEELADSLLRYLKFKIKHEAFCNARSEQLQNIPFLDENFKVQKKSYRTLDDLKERARELKREIEKLEEESEEIEKQRSGETDQSMIGQITTYFQSSRLKQRAIEIQKALHRKRKELKILRTILTVPRRYNDLMEWVKKRETKYEAAVNHFEFESTVEKIQESREEEAGLSGLQPGEFQSMLQGAMEGVTIAAPAGAAGDSSGEDSSPEPSTPSFPPYLQLKRNYTDEDIERVFQAINSGELELGDEISRVRSMLLTGSPRNAIKEIRSILKERT